MAFVEVMEKAKRPRKLQVFATDLNEVLLDKARDGLYAKSLAHDVSPERLKRFFVEEPGGYRVAKALRESVVFARQNLLADPPFSRLDLVSCRNVLIYLEPSLQSKAIPTFHYALKPGGFLMLGASESVGGFADLFEPVNRKHRLFARKATPTRGLHLPVAKAHGGTAPPRQRPQGPIAGNADGSADGAGGALTAQREADRVTVGQFAPPGVLVDAARQVLQFRGSTDGFLAPPEGRPSFDVLKMARPGLMRPLRAALEEAAREKRAACRQDVRVERNGAAHSIDVRVVPLKNLREPCFLVLFEDAAGGAPAPSRAARKPRPQSQEPEAHRYAELEVELAEARDLLQSVQEQHAATTEELQAANEEAQSANEELQSVNEELETSKEELESANEELTTLNDEMASRNAELGRLNGDLVNLQTSARLTIVLLGPDLRIRRFSVQAAKQLNLLATDAGRPIGHIRHGLVDAAARTALDLERFVSEVIADPREQEREVLDADGRWHSLRVRPYMTLDDTVDGAVLVLVDVDALKRSEQAAAAARDYARNALETVREPLLVLDDELRVAGANRSFYRTFRVAPDQTEGRLVYELGNRQWAIPRLRELLDDVVPRDTSVEDFEVTHHFDSIGSRIMLLNARRVADPQRDSRLILLAIEDVTERRRAEDAFRQSHAELATQADELARFNRLAVGREARVIELKKQVNALCRRLGEPPPYPLAFETGAASDSPERPEGDGP